MGFSRQEYWSVLPFPTPGVLPDLGIKPTSPGSPTLAGVFFTTEPPEISQKTARAHHRKEAEEPGVESGCQLDPVGDPVLGLRTEIW